MLSERAKDALTELGNIGAGNATTALSQMLGDRLVRMTTPTVEVLALPEVVEWVGPPGAPVVAASMRLSGDLEGYAALILQEASAQTILREILGPGAQTEASGLAAGPMPLSERSASDLEASALMEIGNIVVTSYLNALSEMTGLVLVPSVPSVAADMLEAVLSSILVEMGDADPGVLAIRTRIEGEGATVEGQLLFVPAAGQLGRLLRALGMAGEEPA